MKALGWSTWTSKSPVMRTSCGIVDTHFDMKIWVLKRLMSYGLSTQGWWARCTIDVEYIQLRRKKLRVTVEGRS